LIFWEFLGFLSAFVSLWQNALAAKKAAVIACWKAEK
jgi:hypothetical protein